MTEVRWRVLVLVESFSGYGRGILRGISRYERQYGPWLIQSEIQPFSGSTLKQIRQWHGDGILVRSTSRDMENALLDTGLPVVDLLGVECDSRLAKVHSDSRQIGRLAAEHLRGCGLRHFGFFAFGRPWWIHLLEEGFCQSFDDDRDLTLSVHVSSPQLKRLRPRWEHRFEKKLVDWLISLPKPVGILAAPIDAARAILNCCQAHGISVPHEVAVMTGDDDDCICNISSPPLSAVRTSSVEVGFQAAQWLDEALRNKTPLQGIRWVQTSDVVVRKSTDTIAVSQPDLVKAISFIRENFHASLSTDDICEAVCLSRRTLERLFQRYLNETPHDELVRCRIRRICELLVQSDLSVEEIASKCGFSAGKYFFSFFQEQLGCTPLQYRRRYW
ncbi:MAG: DNA-binding transcriptional regulator [Planctomycetia bacterium]|nr:DNA-binding transcriptional regulator [Planctomycetia bacterium]